MHPIPLARSHRQRPLRQPQLEGLLSRQSANDAHRRQPTDLATVSAVFALPQTRPRPIAELAFALRRTDRRFAMLDVRDTADRCHARLVESKLLLGRNLHDNMVAELADQRAVRAGRMDQMARLAGILFETVHLGAHRQGAQREGVALVRTNCEQ